jgi:GAF domain-containing protein
LARQAAADARARLAAGASAADVLAELARAGEQIAGPGTAVSILVLDSLGFLRDGASPGLPEDYLRAIVPLKADAGVGTCSAAAATGCAVITEDFQADDKWGELRHLPMSLGYVGAWSHPIKSGDGRVLGTFGTYYRDRRSPTADEREAVGELAEAAAQVLGTR